MIVSVVVPELLTAPVVALLKNYFGCQSVIVNMPSLCISSGQLRPLALVLSFVRSGTLRTFLLR